MLDAEHGSMDHANPADIIDVTAETFMAEVIEKSKSVPVILDFWADWCEPCKNLTPILHGIIEKNPGELRLAKVNTDQEQMLAQQMGVQSLPTVALLMGGQIVDNFMGVKPESEIMAWLEPHVALTGSAPEPVLDSKVQALIDAGAYEDALQVLAAMPAEQAVWQTLDVHLLMNNVAAAQAVYDSLSDAQLKMPEADQAKAKIQLAQVATEDDQLATYQQQIAQGQVEPAIQGLLALLQKDTAQAEVKQLLIASFSLLNDPKLAAQYRRRMGSILN
ncbi:tetratricopeptide repeat protein [Marinicella meishanensis]|uniref:tetratricopeptide repeat protein n=1 Tax=Marinicella meishanensis TaxID=2873263 RepID=UPI001CBDA4A4|nr:tetratricopeptide repeat protein [Marinicella sp. NBU2979]